jgi:hypothetical protein
MQPHTLSTITEVKSIFITVQGAKPGVRLLAAPEGGRFERDEESRISR